MTYLEQIKELQEQGVAMYEIVLAHAAIGGLLMLFVLLFVLHWQTMPK